MGTMKEGARMPSVRSLADQLAVNQNTILKVYNQLCQEKVLVVDRGNGTFVASPGPAPPLSERKQAVAKLLAEAVVQALHFGLDRDQLHELLDREYQSVSRQVTRSTEHE